MTGTFVELSFLSFLVFLNAAISVPHFKQKTASLGSAAPHFGQNILYPIQWRIISLFKSM